MNRFFLIIAALAPAFASPIIGGIPTNAAQRVVYIEQYLYFLLAIGTWNLALFASELFLRKRISQLTLKSLLSALPLFTCLLLALSGLQLFRLHFSSGAFYLLIASLSLHSGAIVLLKRKHSLLAVLALALNSWLIGYMTFTIWGFHFNWQALLFTAGLAGQISSVRLSRVLQGESATLISYSETNITDNVEHSPLNNSHPILTLRIYLLTLLSGFLSTALLVLFAHLSYAFYSVYILLPLIASLANKVRGGDFSQDQGGSKSARILVAYILLIVVTSIFSS
jgi:hypothetical protein